MTVSQGVNPVNGFRKWSIAPVPASNDDGDYPGDATPLFLAEPELDEPIMAPPEQPHRPWLVPGMGTL